MLNSSPQAFDPLAPTYDQDFTHTRTGAYLRGVVHTRLMQHFKMGNYVLELGCGTGEDALYLANQGVHVTATDASPAMLEAARAKVNQHPQIAFQPIDLCTISDSLLHNTTQVFDGAFSNFGPLNILADYRPLAQWLSKIIRPGAIVAFGVMSPYCVWEMAWHSAHGNFPTAFRRFGKKTAFRPDNTVEAIDIYYPTVRRMTREFAPYFRRSSVQGLGLFLPPSDVYGVIEKRSRLFDTLMWLEQSFAHYPALSQFANHYWIEFERVM